MLFLSLSVLYQRLCGSEWEARDYEWWV